MRPWADEEIVHGVERLTVCKGALLLDGGVAAGTLCELQRMYEIVMERPIEKSACRTRVLSSGLSADYGRTIIRVKISRSAANRHAEFDARQYPIPGDC